MVREGVICVARNLPLTNGGYALVDDEDYNRLIGLGWYRWHNRKKRSVYACRNIVKPDGKPSREYLHRAVMGLQLGNPLQVDHKNFDGLDCRKENLRTVTIALHNRNQRLRRTNKSGVKGVKLCKDGRWIARIKLNGKEKSLGVYGKIEEAGFAYNLASELVHGVYGSKNKLASVVLDPEREAEIRKIVEIRVKPLLG